MSNADNMPGTAAPPSIVVLLNPVAGGGQTQQTEIQALFVAAGIQPEILVLEPGRDPADAARDAATRAPIVVAGGGDGTVNGVVAGLAGTGAALGILPLGTLNHFAKDLKIPLDLKKAVAIIAAGQGRAVDLGRVNDRVFLNNSSIGIYPNIVEVREQLQRQGDRKWIAMARATFRVVSQYRGVVVRIAVDDGRQSTWRTPFLFVGNNEYTIEGVGLGSRATLNGGRLFAYLAPRLRAQELPTLLMRAVLGRAKQSGAFQIIPAQELWIETPHHGRIHVALDGEVTTMTTPLHYRTWPGALQVLHPVDVA